MMREPGISLHSKQTNNSRKFTDICKDDDDIDGVVGTVDKYEEGKDGKDKSACGDSEVNQDETIIKNKNGNND